MSDVTFLPETAGESTAIECDFPLFDKSEPRSLINIIWKEMVDVLDTLQQAKPELFELSERRLTSKAKPEPIHHMLRLRLWAEYDRAQLAGKKMQQYAVTSGICNREFWSRSICRDYERLAFILMPPPKYITRMESLLYMGLDQIEDILALPIKDEETGKIDTRLISEKVKIFQMLDLRVKGAVVQKIAMHSRIDQHTQISRGSDPLASLPLNDLEALDSSIQMVKRQIEKAHNREVLLLDANLSEGNGNGDGLQE